MMSMDYSKKQKQKYKELNRRLMQYVAMVNQIYQSYNEEASRIAMTTGYNSDSEGDFKFSDYPKTKYSIEKLQRNFADNMQALIYSGISKEWKNSNDAQDLLANEILKKYKGQVNGEKQKIIYQTNSDAMKAFANRTDKGLDLSDKVWKQSDEYVRALEAAISTAISKGTSAVTLSKQISKYLIDFDKLQKDYKSQFGQATDIHDCEYRSARLARSEINMAYRTAEQTRWNEMDFVRGYRIELSNNHSDRRKKHGEYSDICDELQGDYPKDFKWTGWHPNCRCHAVPLLMSEEDFIRWNNGESVDKNLIKDVPENYKRWAAENADKIEQAGARGTQPYFVRDNKKYMQEAKRSAEITKDIDEKLNKATKPHEKNAFVSFEPFSTAIMEAVNSAKNRKQKNAIFDSIINDERATILNETNGYSTKLFPNNKGTNKPTWEDTKNMAYDMNKIGINVTFLPELKNGTSADALIQIGKTYRLVDFKYAITTNDNTLSKDLEKGFTQANTLVLKLVNMDSGQFRETIEYLKRNNIKYGNILLHNEYGKIIELSEKEIRSGFYKKKLKGFL